MKKLTDMVGDFLHSAGRILDGGGMLDQMVTLAAGDNVQMGMFDNLTGSQAGINEKVVPLSLYGLDHQGGNFGKGLSESRYNIGRTILKPGKMLFGNH